MVRNRAVVALAQFVKEFESVELMSYPILSDVGADVVLSGELLKGEGAHSI